MANVYPPSGASVATGGPFCQILTTGENTVCPTIDTCAMRRTAPEVVLGGTEKVTVAGYVLPLPPETIVTPFDALTE